MEFPLKTISRKEFEEMYPPSRDKGTVITYRRKKDYVNAMKKLMKNE